MKRIHELREQRAKRVKEMRAIADAAEKESRDYTQDEEKRHGELKTEITALDEKLARAAELEELERSAPAVHTSGRQSDRFEERARHFSLARAIAARCGDDVDDGLEREISCEVRRQTGRKFSGIAVPDEYFLEQRTMTTTGSAAGLFQVQHRGEMFIDVLRSALVTGRLGATILDGLIGDTEIPKQTASANAQHVAEDGQLTETDPGTGDVKLQPKTVGALTSFARRALINSVPSVENLVRSDLAGVIANAIDFQAIFGDGTGDTPNGIVNTGGTHDLTLSTPSWSEVLEFIASIESDDAAIGSLGWVLHPRGVKKLRSTNKVAGEPEHGFLMEAAAELAGFPVAATSAVPVAGTPPASAAIFGAWSQLLIGYWSGVDVLVNPYSEEAYTRGRVQVRAMRDYDVAVRHPESFAHADDLQN